MAMNENYALSTEKLNEIRTSVDIVDVISEYLPLTGRGRNFFGVCPFHDDHSPSMSVNRERQIYKCFSCGAGGNVFSFIRDYENISFMQAVQKIAAKSGIPLQIASESEQSFTKRNTYHEMYAIACKLYTNNLYTEEGLEAIDYLERRQISKEARKEFEIGLSLKNSHLLTGLLDKKGFKKEEMVQNGLAHYKDGEFRDNYFNRIMFPLFDLTGKTVGFSARIYRSNDASKYINTKETEFFKKGELLYHYHKAKNIARMKEQVILVEGFMDVIRLFTIGIENVVASMGTAVTKEQLLLLKKMGKEIILLFDGDEAGRHAAYKTSSDFMKMGVYPKIVVLEDNLDPDEYILKYGKEKIEYKIAHPMNTIDFKLEYLKEDKNFSSPLDKANYISSVIEELNQITDPILRETTLLKISEETAFDASIIRSQLMDIQDTVKQVSLTPQKEGSSLKRNRYQEAERRLVFYMLNHEEIIELYKQKVKFLSTETYRLLAKEIHYFYEEHGYIKEADFINVLLEDNELLNTFHEITSLDLKDTYKKEEIDEYIDTIYEYKIIKQIDYLKSEQKKTVDQEKKKKLGDEILELQIELQKKKVWEEL